MILTVEVPDYTESEGVKSSWEKDFKINVNVDGEVIISANKAGLTSLAIQLLTLAQNDVPLGAHFHYDEFNSLEDGSASLIIEKIA